MTAVDLAPPAGLHAAVHPRPVQGCPWCPQPAVCIRCEQPRSAHTAAGWVACADLLRAGEIWHWRNARAAA